MATKSTTRKPEDSVREHESVMPLTGAERVRLLREIRGMWRNRRPDPQQELKKIRDGWERRPPSKK